jgi:hypothetical protein
MRFLNLIKYIVRREIRDALRPPRTEDELWHWAIK